MVASGAPGSGYPGGMRCDISLQPELPSGEEWPLECGPPGACAWAVLAEVQVLRLREWEPPRQVSQLTWPPDNLTFYSGEGQLLRQYSARAGDEWALAADEPFALWDVASPPEDGPPQLIVRFETASDNPQGAAPDNGWAIKYRLGLVARASGALIALSGLQDGGGRLSLPVPLAVGGGFPTQSSARLCNAEGRCGSALSAIEDLAPLRGISVLEAPALVIAFNGGLRNLTGLEDLRQISGSLAIEQNSRSLRSLAGIGALESIGGGLRLVRNAALESVAGLGSLTSVGQESGPDEPPGQRPRSGLQIQCYGDAQKSLSGLDALRFVHGTVEISYCTLTTLEGLGGLETVDGSMFVEFNPTLRTLAGADSLASVAGFLRITRNGGLERIAGLDSLETVGSLVVSQNNNFAALDGFAKLKAADLLFVSANPALKDVELDALIELQNFQLYNNAGLLELRGLQSLRRVVKLLEVQGNKQLARISGLGALEAVGTLILYANEKLRAFSPATAARLRVVGGDFTFKFTGFIDFPQFPSLELVGGGFRIENNLDLESLTGVNNLTKVGSLKFDGNLKFDQVTGLMQLRADPDSPDVDVSLTGGLYRDLSGLSPFFASLTSAGSITVENSKMEKLPYFPVLTSIDSLSLAFNEQIQNFDRTFPALSRVAGDVTISKNGALRDLSGLESVEEVGGKLSIEQERSLLSLDGLGGLRRLLGGLSIAANAELEDVSALGDLQTISAFVTVDETGSAQPGLRLILNKRLATPFPEWISPETLAQKGSEAPQTIAVSLKDNALYGRVPEGLCGVPGLVSLDVGGNPGMCGVLPDRCAGIVGDVGTGVGGACNDVEPPLCEGACALDVPNITSNPLEIPFSFNVFTDPAGLPLTYEWAVGSDSGKECCVENIRPFAYSGLEVDESEGRVTGKFDVSRSFLSFENGFTYFVSARALNTDLLRSAVLTTAEGTLVDTTPPIVEEAACTLEVGHFLSPEGKKAEFEARWEGFKEPESSISTYEYKLMSSPDGGTPKYSEVAAGSVPSSQKNEFFADKPPVPGRIYELRVRAVNRAALSSTAVTCQVVIPGGGGVSMALILSLGLGIPFILLLVGWYFFQRWHEKRMALVRQKQRDSSFLEDLVETALLPLSRKTNMLVLDPEKLATIDLLTFVHTDIQNSSKLSNVNKGAYGIIQQRHDQIMRRALSSHGGFEIATEGDAFQIAFAGVHSALEFCFEVQEALLNLEWPAEIYALDGESTSKIYGKSGLVWAGPRVRMGMHVASRKLKEFTIRESVVTHRLSFKGPGWDLAIEVGDIGSGGQIIMTPACREELYKDLSLCGFPVISQIGAYALQSTSTPMLMFQAVPSSIREMGGSPLAERLFPDLRNVLRLPEEEAGRGRGVPEGLCCLVASTVSVPQKGSFHALADLPPEIWEPFAKLQGALAEQFQGTAIIRGEQIRAGGGAWELPPLEGKVRRLLTGAHAFQDPSTALRYAMSLQILLLREEWPAAHWSNWTSSLAFTSRDDEGGLLHRGLRCGSLIHIMHGEQHTAVSMGPPESGPVSRAVSDFQFPEGQADSRARAAAVVDALLPFVCGGQIAVTKPVWAAVQTSGFGQIHAMDIGWIRGPRYEGAGDAWRQGTRLWEILPKGLERRSLGRTGFPPLENVVSPGFDVQDSAKGAPRAAICPVFVYKGELPARPGGRDPQDLENDFADVIRASLAVYGGYYVKAMGAWSFVLAFEDTMEALRWAVAALAWLKARGAPRAVRIGCSWGQPTYSAPSATSGRADFFGSVMNVSSRAASAASAGQVIFAASQRLCVAAFQAEGLDLDHVVMTGPRSEVVPIGGAPGGSWIKRGGAGIFRSEEEPQGDESRLREVAKAGAIRGSQPMVDGPAAVKRALKGGAEMDVDGGLKFLYLGVFELKNIKLPSGKPEPHFLMHFAATFADEGELKRFPVPRTNALPQHKYRSCALLDQGLSSTRSWGGTSFRHSWGRADTGSESTLYASSFAADPPSHRSLGSGSAGGSPWGSARGAAGAPVERQRSDDSLAYAPAVARAGAGPAGGPP